MDELSCILFTMLTTLKHFPEQNFYQNGSYSLALSCIRTSGLCYSYYFDYATLLYHKRCNVNICYQAGYTESKQIINYKGYILL